METLRIEKEGHFCWLKLNRPEAMNALNTQMARELIAAAEEIALDREVWVVGITTTSDKSFGVGADLKERKDMTPGQIVAQRVLFTRAMIALKNLPSLSWPA
jgi:enoyl-CoA hydratase